MVTNMRIAFTEGIFNEQSKSMRFQYITDNVLRQSLWEKVLGIGNIAMHSAGEEIIPINGVSQPLLLKKQIDFLVRKHTAHVKQKLPPVQYFNR